MRTIFAVVLVLGVASFAEVSPARAQVSSEAALVKIPFTFIAGDKLLPPGTYEIWSESSDWEMMAVSSVKNPKDALVWIRTSPGPNPEPRRRDVRVQFTNYFGHRFLQFVQLPLSDIHIVRLSTQQAERTLTRLNLMPIEGERGDDIR